MYNLKLVLATLIVASSTHSLFAQEEFLFSVVSSKFAEHKESINQLIELQVMDNQLQLSRLERKGRVLLSGKNIFPL